MAIRVRRGNEADFDVNKMLPGEWAVSLDTKYVRMCFAPGVCLRMATYETFESDMERIESILAEVESIEEAIKVIQRDINANVDVAIEQKELASEYAEQSKEYARQAKESADRAAEVADIGYGSSDRAGIVAPQDIYVDPSNGHMELIATASASPLKNSYDGGLRFTEMIGASEQNTTTGKNLLKVHYTGKTENGITFTQNADGSVIVNGTATANATYILASDINSLAELQNNKYVLSGCPNGGSDTTYRLQFWNYKGDGNAQKDLGNGVTFDFTNGGTGASYNIAVVVTSGAKVSNLVFKPMLRLASVTDATYEPYTGGIPSPNPDYPQEIKSVSISEIKTHSKNLLDITTLKPRNSTQGGSVSFVGDVANISSINQSWAVCKSDVMAVEKGKKYVLRFDISDYSATTRTYVTSSNANDVEYGSKDFNGTNGYCEYVFTPTEDTLIISIFSNGSSNKVTNTFTLSNMQLELGEKATEYVPFAESVVTPTGFKLNAIGNVKDRLIRKDGLWQVERNVLKYSITGNETIQRSSNTQVDRYLVLLPTLSANVKSALSNNLCMCTKGIAWNNGNDVTVGRCGIDTNIEYARLAYNYAESGTATMDGFRADITGAEVLLVLKTPTYEELPLADQVALNSLLTFDGTTYLDIESVLEPQFELEYGTSKVGGYTLQSLNTAEANNARLNAMETVTNNMAAAVLQGEE